MRLQDKVVIVTGSTTGIGKAIALRCVTEGARVVLHGLEPELGSEVLSQIPKGKAVLQIEDIAAPGAPARLTKLALEKFGRIDAIVNNAAWVVSSDIESTDRDFLRQVLEVNTISPFALIQVALPHLKKTAGCVLNIGSVNAWSGEENLLAYSISKGALMTLTRNLGDTLFREHGVRVNQINPGWVLTEKEIQRKTEHGLKEDWYKDLPKLFAPSGKLIAPAEIAAAAIYWLADESGPVSGQVVDLEQYPMAGRNPPKEF